MLPAFPARSVLFFAVFLYLGFGVLLVSGRLYMGTGLRCSCTHTSVCVLSLRRLPSTCLIMFGVYGVWSTSLLDFVVLFSVVLIISYVFAWCAVSGRGARCLVLRFL